jgi:hypothetical protein
MYMPVNNKYSQKLDGIGGLFPGHTQPSMPDPAMDALQSQVITGFEAALDQGMHPVDALDVIIGWVLNEMARMKTERGGSAS